VGSGFLNRLEKPIDICKVTAAAGAAFVTRTSSYAPDLVDEMVAAIDYEGFSVVDMWGMCPGRYTKRNKLTPKRIEAELADLPRFQDRCRITSARSMAAVTGKWPVNCPHHPGRQK
jgi:2-oxoglutarate ferredoxin oxidoreductase subunit beta